ncbi:MAG: efflux RND transporter permease subunit [Alphaproteobacteria bacterium]
MIRAVLLNRRLLVLVLGFLLVLGLSAVQTLPRLEDPTLVARNATVLTFYPGADAERVEALVTKPIEDELRTLSEIDTLSAASRTGVSVLSIVLKDEIADVAPVWSLIRDKLADAAPALPADVSMPSLDDEQGTAHTILVALRWTAGTPANRLILRRYAEALRDRLRGVRGTDHVRLHGAPTERVDVSVDPYTLAAADLSVASISAALSAADIRVPAGRITGPRTQFPVDLAGSFDGIQRLRDVPVTATDGRTLRLGDIAHIARGIADPPEELALTKGGAAVLVGARMQPAQRVDLWVRAAERTVADFAASLPDGVEAEILFDQAHYTERRLGEVVESLLLGLAIVIAVLLVTMGWRSAGLVGLALMASALLTLGLFPAIGLQIHQMSIIGIIVALGLMVDNAIVTTNTLRHLLGQGVDPVSAVTRTLRQLAVPLLASTVTTMLAFMPIVLLPGGAGEFVGPLALAVIVSLAGSYIVALFIVPALGPRLLPGPSSGAAGRAGWWTSGLSMPSAQRRFARFLEAVAKRPGVALAASLAVPMIGFAAFPTFDVAFFPPADRDQFRIEVRASPAASMDRTAAIAEPIDAWLRGLDGVRNVTWVLGGSGPMLYYNVLGGEDANPRYAAAIVDTRSVPDTNRLVPAVQAGLDRTFPEVEAIVRKYEQGPPFHAPVELRLYGPDLAVLVAKGRELAALLASLPQVVHAHALVHDDAPKLRIAVREQDARLAGLGLSDVAAQVDAALSGRPGGFVLEGMERLPVSVRFPNAWRADPARLGGLPLAVFGDAAGVAAAGLPLAAIADTSLVPSWSGIQRRNGERLQIVRGYIASDALPAVVQRRLEGALAERGLALPPDYRLEMGGETEERGQAVGGLLSSVAMLAVLMVATVALTFNSFRRMGIVMLAGAQAFGLGLVALLLAGHTFGFVIIVGLLGLVGVAVNATIIIVSALDEAGAAGSGDPGLVARVVSGPVARHIWSTTITTVAGFVPLMLVGGEFWPPFAETFAGGLLLATLIAFVGTPALYALTILRPRPADPAAETVGPGVAA